MNTLQNMSPIDFNKRLEKQTEIKEKEELPQFSFKSFLLNNINEINLKSPPSTSTNEDNFKNSSTFIEKNSKNENEPLEKKIKIKENNINLSSPRSLPTENNQDNIRLPDDQNSLPPIFASLQEFTLDENTLIPHQNNESSPLLENPVLTEDQNSFIKNEKEELSKNVDVSLSTLAQTSIVPHLNLSDPKQFDIERNINTQENPLLFENNFSSESPSTFNSSLPLKQDFEILNENPKEIFKEIPNVQHIENLIEHQPFNHYYDNPRPPIYINCQNQSPHIQFNMIPLNIENTPLMKSEFSLDLLEMSLNDEATQPLSHDSTLSLNTSSPLPFEEKKQSDFLSDQGNSHNTSMAQELEKAHENSVQQTLQNPFDKVFALQQMMQNFQAQLQKVYGQKNFQLKFPLKHSSLGDVDVHLKIKDGYAQATFLGDQEDMIRLLSQSRKEIENILKDSNFTIDNYSIQIMQK